MSKLIGLGGYAQSGKDAVAAILETEGFKRTYMAKAVENALLALDPVVVDYRAQLEGLCLKRPRRYSEIHAAIGYEASKKIPEVRRLYQRMGTDLGRDMFGRFVWIDRVFPEIDDWMEKGYDVCITGIRYHNELRAIKERRGVNIWVDRDQPPVNDHISDNNLKAADFDAVLPNHGTLRDLGVAVRSWLGN